MLASYDKIVKYLVEKFQTSLSPLEQIARNQEIIIAQNKQVIDLLAQLNNGRQTECEPEADVSECPPSPVSSSSETEE